jgi:hypothetical protein
MAKTIMNRARKYKWLIFISAYIILLAFLAIFDERLNPEVKSFVNVYPDRVSAEENAYYAVLGFNAPPGTDIHAKGIEIVQSFEEALRKNPSLAEFDQKKLFGGPELSFMGQLPEFYKDRGFSCLKYAKTSKKDIEKLLADNHQLLDRYYSLYRYPRFRDTAPMAPPGLFPLFAAIRNTNRLMLLSFAQEANAGRMDAVLDGLKRDIGYWRLVLKESNELITKLVAVSIIKTDYLFLSELISRNKIDPAHLQIAGSLMGPLEPDEVDMSGAMRREFEFTMNGIRAIKDSFLQMKSGNEKESRWKIILWPFLKVNASTNIIYPSHKKLAGAAALPAKDLVSESRKWEGTKKLKLGLNAFYNFVGAIMHKPIGDLENLKYLPYLTRVHDLDGLIRLVSLQFSAKRQGITYANMDAFFKKADVRYSNPYTGAPMKWDAGEKCLYFESLSRENEKPKRVELFL